MKKFFAAACAAAFLMSVGCSSIVRTADNTANTEGGESKAPVNEKAAYEPLNYREQVGLWLPYVRFPEYMQGKSEAEFRKAVAQIMEDAAADSVNTAYFHVRPNGDAYYASELFPKGTYLDGDYDPLEIVLEEAHKRGISVHGWINPLRLQTAEQMNNVPDSFIVKKWINAGEPYVKNVGGRWYLDPAYPETEELLRNSVREVLDNYDVDGIHIDDYFYPTTDPEFDRIAFETSGSGDLAQWRIENVNRFVKAMYDTVKAKDKRLVFGISPQGNIDADYNSQYADVRRWSSEEGFCDYIVPQIYFGFENENSPFLPTLNQWEELVDESKVSLIIGLAAYKLGREDKWAGEAAELEWINDPDIISKQIMEVKKSSADGYALYY
ncbi:MAG: family 10 glycosylhydrolase [Ruminococcus sp.]|uniref:glycoside hydrolase family 10 protein n=1 Tax=Ruminococcus sp. TaxID=41978 RepID=UPI0025F4EEEB|nr:family 10 glycosylhydrolase [Ruminococcus sp.]MCR4793759.1 family 10 glycosylhydrolase [Ruminococcus sp.]